MEKETPVSTFKGVGFGALSLLDKGTFRVSRWLSRHFSFLIYSFIRYTPRGCTFQRIIGKFIWVNLS